jgi:uncharacterized protein with HEPN domain
MVDAAEDVASFIDGRVRKDLDTDRQLSLALARAIEIIGEAASKISSETRGALPTVAWKLAIAMRNRLAHVYFDIEHDVLWSTATKEIPLLLPILRSALGDEGAER